MSLLFLFPGAAFAGTGGQDEAVNPVLLTVSVNGQRSGESEMLLRDADGAIYASAKTLKSWRLRIPEGRAITFEGDIYHRLDSSAALKLAVSDTEQTMEIQAAASQFERQRSAFDQSDDMPMTKAGTGAFANYDIFFERSRNTNSVNGALEAGVFTPHGVGATTFLGRMGAGKDEITRLETNWTIDRPGQVTSIRIGDGISGGGPSSPPVRFAGVQFARNFAIRPGFVTIALPSVSGSAAVPSVVDIYVNNVLQGSREVEPGPFDITGVPLQSGGGNLQLVVRDLLGRETVSTQNYYAATDTLRRGLSDFSYEVGFLRRNFGIKSNHYGTFVASGTHRYGLTDRLTTEAHFQFTGTHQVAAAGLAATVDNIGLVNASATVSQSNRGTGQVFAASVERRVSGVSLGVRGELASRNFAFVGMSRTELAPKLVAQAFLDIPFSLGSVGVNYLRRDNRGRDDETLAGAFASLNLGRVGTMQIFARRSTVGRSQTVVGAFLAIPLGGRRSASASVEYGRGEKNVTLSIQKDPPVGSGSGYRATASLGTVDRIEGLYSLNTSIAAFGAQVGYGRSGAAVRLSANGALGLLGSQVFASRRLGTSFGAVQLDGLPNVRVYADNNLIGTTDKSGKLIIPSLNAYQRNVIRLDEADLPLDFQFPAIELAVRPFARTGNIVPFVARRERGALLQVVLEDGSELPAGATVTVAETGDAFAAASGGEIYIPDLVGRARLEASWDNQRCGFEVLVPANDDPQPRVEDLICRKAESYAAQ